ncbi:Uncharacterised protein [Mycobacteroides abscessus subsp. abscessus]|nr:Uncharacterised protein [Mycobacteroides abscessus subsp. abscessus]
MKPRSGDSAITLASTACPVIAMSSCANESGRPAATLICSATRSVPDTSSLTGCST